jgi:hypothetical protein
MYGPRIVLLHISGEGVRENRSLQAVDDYIRIWGERRHIQLKVENMEVSQRKGYRLGWERMLLQSAV